MMTAGRRERLWKVAIGFAVFALAAYAALALLAAWIDRRRAP